MCMCMCMLGVGCGVWGECVWVWVWCKSGMRVVWRVRGGRVRVLWSVMEC